MATVESFQNLRNDLILKFSLGAAIFADITAATIADMFDTDNASLLALPAGYKSAGFLTEDGVTESRAITTDDTMGWQSAEVLRSDVSKDVFTLKATFRETNPVTLALAENQNLADMPALGTAVTLDHPASGNQPLRRLLLLGHDTQTDIIYGRFLPRVKITDIGDRKLMRTDPTAHEVTITAYSDPAYGTSSRLFIGGAGWLALT